MAQVKLEEKAPIRLEPPPGYKKAKARTKEEIKIEPRRRPRTFIALKEDFEPKESSTHAPVRERVLSQSLARRFAPASISERIFAPHVEEDSTFAPGLVTNDQFAPYQEQDLVYSPYTIESSTAVYGPKTTIKQRPRVIEKLLGYFTSTTTIEDEPKYTLNYAPPVINTAIPEQDTSISNFAPKTVIKNKVDISPEAELSIKVRPRLPSITNVSYAFVRDNLFKQLGILD